MPVFTVFTPTYNRENLIHRVYDSLCAQTFRDFEWLIVDDGSTDGTRVIIEEWQKKSYFPIRYIFQERGHKKKAFNRGVREAEGELFLPLDSDDTALPYALETFYYYWTDIVPERRGNFVGVCALCADEKGQIIGDLFPQDIFESDSLECQYRYRIAGEKWGCLRTDILRQFPFPTEITGFVPEGIVWSAIAKHYKTRFINHALRIYYRELDSITQAVNSFREIQGMSAGRALYSGSVLENDLSWFFYNPPPCKLGTIKRRRYFLSFTLFPSISIIKRIAVSTVSERFKSVDIYLAAMKRIRSMSTEQSDTDTLCPPSG